MAALALCLMAWRAYAYTVEISPDEMQAAVGTAFPIRQEIPFVSTVISDPKVYIVKSSNRVRLAVVISATFANQPTSTGRAEIEGSLGYDAGRGEFHLQQPAITDLRFDALPADQAELVKSMVNAVAEQILPNLVIYRLDERDFRQGMMRRMLKDVKVQNGKLIAELDW